MSAGLLSAPGLIAAAALMAVSSQVQEARPRGIQLPLPEVERTTRPHVTLFDRPAVVLIARIIERREVEARTFEGESFDPPRWWGAVKVQPRYIARVNERRKGDPDLARVEFAMEQSERGEKPLRFEFGQEYLLLLNPSPMLRGRPSSAAEIDLYKLAIPEGGFAIVDHRLVPIVSGGQLDAYKGRLVNDVLREITRPIK